MPSSSGSSRPCGRWVSSARRRTGSHATQGTPWPTIAAATPPPRKPAQRTLSARDARPVTTTRGAMTASRSAAEVTHETTTGCMPPILVVT
jgi:hypothetical protein